MSAPHTLLDLLSHGDAAAPAISAPGRRPMSYAALREQTAHTATTLNALGIARGDTVAIVLPNGPEMASAFLGIAAAATAAPLNPGYRAEEFGFYLSDLDASLLLVQEGVESPAIAVARERGIRVATLRPDFQAVAGTFSLETPAATAKTCGAAGADDVALVLHTSGTTSRPKIVPLTWRNLSTSAHHIATSLALTSADRALNVMPLFHIHGLVAALLVSLAAGGCVSCTPGFNALQFFAQLEASGATWYTAVPTMHQAILARAMRNAEAVRNARLRFIRSSSAPLPPQVMADLEAVFRVPVIEAYGMTEAAHQMASNPLPPRARKPGSVGVAAGPEIAIMGDAGRLLPQGKTGEVVIRGPNVISGYCRNPQANAVAFVDGWFRTGDQGVLDEEGYLRITGRLKEIINRGGEKISPREVDEVLLDHPAVAEAICFAVPHEKLGEDVAAAVVLKEGMAVTERELRDHVGARLAGMKVPRRIVFLTEIPKGATGKLQRIGLAQKLGLA